MKALYDAIRAAESRIRPWIIETPLEASPIGPHLKLEDQQHTGSFKTRGAFSKLLSLAPGVRSAGVIAASTGNHGAAVAYAAAKLGIKARIVVPAGANPGKLAKIRALGGEIDEYGDDSAVAERHARAVAERDGIPYVSPYNDLDVIAGQGTIGVELARQLPRVDVLFIALGGGGLLAGIAAYLKVSLPKLHVVGCSPENSAVLIESLRAGRILDLPSRPTLSDGTAGGVEPGAITFDLCRRLADELVTVSESEIGSAMRLVHRTHGRMIEGAAGVAVAGYLRQAERWRGKTAAAILCGGNVDPAVFTRLGAS